MRASIIIPLYNEKNRLPKLLESLEAFLNQEKNIEFVLVNDGSNDQTGQIIKESSIFSRIKLYQYDNNKGKGYAIRHGIYHASADIIGYYDADMSVPLSEIPKTLDFFNDPNIHCVFGSRFIKSEMTSYQSSKRKYLSLLFSKIFQLKSQSQVSDSQIGYKFFRSTSIKPLLDKLRINRFGFDLEIISYLQNKNIKNISVHWEEKSGSKINIFKDGIHLLMILFKVNWKKK